MVMRRCCCFPVSQVCGLLAVVGGLGCTYRQTWERCLTMESSVILSIPNIVKHCSHVCTRIYTDAAWLALPAAEREEDSASGMEGFHHTELSQEARDTYKVRVDIVAEKY